MFRDGKVHLVIGAPGATQIAMGVLQVTLNVLEFDMTMLEAVSAPRFSATSDAIDLSNRIPRAVARALAGRVMKRSALLTATPLPGCTASRKGPQGWKAAPTQRQMAWRCLNSGRLIALCNRQALSHCFNPKIYVGGRSRLV